MIECKTYTLAELKKVLKISKRQWEDRKDDVLEHLKLYFDYEIFKAGRGYSIIIHEQYNEYEPLPHKSKVPEIKQYYYEKTKEEVSRQHWNTGSCIARNLISKKENKYSHTEGTMANYIRPIIRNNFNEPNGKHQWMKMAEDRLSYLPLSEEEAGYLKQLFDAHNTNNQSAEIMGLYKAGYLTKREAQEKIFNITDYWYGSIMNEFREKFHFTPICIKYLEEVLNFNSESNADK